MATKEAQHKALLLPAPALTFLWSRQGAGFKSVFADDIELPAGQEPSLLTTPELVQIADGHLVAQRSGTGGFVEVTSNAIGFAFGGLSVDVRTLVEHGVEGAAIERRQHLWYSGDFGMTDKTPPRRDDFAIGDK